MTAHRMKMASYIFTSAVNSYFRCNRTKNFYSMAEATLNYQSIRTTHAAREADDLRIENRKKHLIILILQWLAEEGYVESARQLEHETNLDVSKYDVCDNVDLDTILQEYESYFYIKFNRYPKLTKKNTSNGPYASKISAKLASAQSNVRRSNIPSLPRVANNGTDAAVAASAGTLNRPPSTGDALRRLTFTRKLNRSNSEKLNTHGTTSSTSSPNQSANNSMNQSTNSLEEMSLSFMKVSSVKTAASANDQQQQQQQQQNGNKKKFPTTIIDCRAILNDTLRAPVDDNGDPADRLLKPLGGFNGYNSEWRELAEVISRDIYLHDPSVRWDSIIGLDAAKRTIKEAVVYPIRYPQLFTGILSPWKGLLLYGPPGTGKTLLAKAVATECKTTFFNISASSIVSKWRGDSEKLVRVLFELARFHAPSTIFLDELDAIMSQRGGGNAGAEHEGSRRMKTELLVQLDGLAKSDDLVFLLAASNLPWELDHAILRRLEKRVLVDLPSREARQAMFQQFLPPTVIREGNGLILFSDLDYTRLSQCTEGYSGADIKLVCKEAAMNPVRKVFDILESLDDDAELGQCIQLDTITTADVEKVLSTTKPSARAFKDKYTQWQKEFESV